jgi:hypothetical protein
VGSLVHDVAVDVYGGTRVLATDHATGRTLVLSARTGRVLRTLSGCPGADHVALGGAAWVVVACHDADALAVWLTRGRRTLVPVGAGPHGVVVGVT